MSDQYTQAIIRGYADRFGADVALSPHMLLFAPQINQAEEAGLTPDEYFEWAHIGFSRVSAKEFKVSKGK